MSTDTEFGPPLRGGPNYKGSDGYGPAETSRRRLFARGGRGLAFLAVLLLVAVAIPMSLLLVANARIDKTPVDRLASGGAPLNVLVVGSDSREDLSPEERVELSTGGAEGDRADTIMLVSMQGRDTAILAFPRDLYVTRCDGSQGRINAAGSAGPACLVETVTDLSGIPVHHYLETRFGGFREVVDALGGVEMCLDQPIRDASAAIDLPSGCQQLDGADALGYVRVRNIDDDFGRISRQQEFLQALASEATEPTNILNLPKMFRVANRGGSALRASDSVGPVSLGRIGWGARGLATGAQTHTVPTTPATLGGASVLQPDQPAAQAMFEAFRTGEILESS